MFPFEFLDHLVNHFNRVIRETILTLSANRLVIQFKRGPYSDRSVVVSLFTKLVTAFKTISDKYVQVKDQHTQIRINIEDGEEYYRISVSGVIFIPPGKILNLFSLILWYHIRYTTGTKPGSTDEGRNLNEKWKQEEKHLRFEINQSKRRMSMAREEGPCYFCGEPSYKINEWEFRPYSGFRGIEMQTRVCDKHITKLI